MADKHNYGLKALVASFRICDDTNCPCKSDHKQRQQIVNMMLDPAHQINRKTYKAICHDLDKNPLPDCTDAGAGGKDRGDGNFDRLVEEAFKVFRDQERAIALKAPEGVVAAHLVSSGREFWSGAAHLRRHLEFLFVLKGIKPCLLFQKYGDENQPYFTTVVIDCLVPIMKRFHLWSYGFDISVQSGLWVFFDARSPKLPAVKKVFLTHHSAKKADPVAYPVETWPGVPDHETAEALGYPVPFDDYLDGDDVSFRDATEFEFLASHGWPEDQRCCVPVMGFLCPTGDESAWKKALDLYRKCQEAAKSVGTNLVLDTEENPPMCAWLEENPGMIEGLSWFKGEAKRKPRGFGGRPRFEQAMEMLNAAAENNDVFKGEAKCKPRGFDGRPRFEQAMEMLNAAAENNDVQTVNALLATMGLKLVPEDEDVKDGEVLED